MRQDFIACLLEAAFAIVQYYWDDQAERTGEAGLVFDYISAEAEAEKKKITTTKQNKTNSSRSRIGN